MMADAVCSKHNRLMNPLRLRLCRSILFLPASNPRAVEKARWLDADMVILDLEDAVKTEDKDMARAAAIAAVAKGFGDRVCAVRLNAYDSETGRKDADALASSAVDVLILPKVERAEDVADCATRTGKPILAMIETAKGVLAAEAIAPGTAALIAGTNDLSADLGIPLGVGRTGLAHSLQKVVLAARGAGIAAFDGVYNGLEDEEGLAGQCEEGRAFGFDGKSLIHPGQIATANRIFGPSGTEIASAERLIAAATGGAERHEGRMIEQMHVDQARAVLAKARRAPA